MLINQPVSYTTLESVGQSVSHHMLVNLSVKKLDNPSISRPVSESPHVNQSVRPLSEPPHVSQSVCHNYTYTTLESLGQSVSHHMLVNQLVTKLYNS